MPPSHQCHICGQSFWRQWNLRRHEETHEKEREKHRCPQCPVAFIRFEDLRKHTWVSHMPGSVRREEKDGRPEERRREEPAEREGGRLEKKRREGPAEEKEERPEEERREGPAEEKGGEPVEKRREGPAEEKEGRPEEERREGLAEEEEGSPEEGEEMEDLETVYHATISLMGDELDELLGGNTPVSPRVGGGKPVSIRGPTSPTLSTDSTSSSSSSGSSSDSESSSSSSSSPDPSTSSLQPTSANKSGFETVDIIDILKGRVKTVVEKRVVYEYMSGQKTRKEVTLREYHLKED